MYEARGEKPRRFGLRKRTFQTTIPQGLELVCNNGVDAIGLTVEPSGALVIKSYGFHPVRVAYRAQPQMDRPAVTLFLHPGKSEVITPRSHITITSLDPVRRERIIIEAPEPKPLTYTNGEVKALMTGIDLMRP